MVSNEQLIVNFYNAFQQLDYKKMVSNYADDIVFFNPVFGLLKDDEVRLMWQMLCKDRKDFYVTYSEIVHLDDEYSTCNWVEIYTFSKTGKKVITKGKAYMKFDNGKIIEHSDGFSIHQWSKQALGLIGVLFGWNTYFQNRIKRQAKNNLITFINSNY